MAIAAAVIAWVPATSPFAAGTKAAAGGIIAQEPAEIAVALATRAAGGAGGAGFYSYSKKPASDAVM